ncbi:acyl carrier protein [Coprobacter tertius]|uniref:Acyl carrier protein n=1 Tax=Coprobacter tertius TaxID=2944915 RepID=A0ABT1MKN9_9BACT|nr:acyl carrier protein [Coprobacter tertius]MCP9613051.1 acyl carrier protein [Coprobacter tertius]
MEELRFINNMSSLLYKTQKDNFGPSTHLKELQEWNLLFATSCVMMIEEEYHVHLDINDLSHVDTVSELYRCIRNLQK